jgi:hypothetical protein
MELDHRGAGSFGRDAGSISELVSWSRSTPAIVARTAIAAIGGGAATGALWLGFMALVFRGEDAVDGVSSLAFIVLGVGGTALVMLALYVGVGVLLIRRRPPEDGRAVPTVALLAVPVAAVVVVAALNL